MVQSDQSTWTQHVNAPEWLSYADEPVTSVSLVRNADQAARSLAHRTDARTTAARGLEPKTVTLPTAAGHEQYYDGLSGMLQFPIPQRHRKPTFHAQQEWEGYVLEVGDTDFAARLVDLTAGSQHEQEEADIPLAEISDRDSPSIRPGSVFRWVIGYERSVAGTRRRVSQIVFRDLPEITETDLRDGEEWANDAIQSLMP